MHSKDKIASQIYQNTVYKWPCAEENCNLSYIGTSGTCLENKVKEHNSHVNITLYKCIIGNSHPPPQPTSPTSRIAKKLGKELENLFILEYTTVHSTITQEKCMSQKSSTTFLEQTDHPMSLTKS